MPRSRKSIKWMVVVGNNVVQNIRSKTYRGACFKAFKKVGIEPPKCVRKRVSDYVNPTKIQYDDHFQGTYCIAQ